MRSAIASAALAALGLQAACYTTLRVGPAYQWGSRALRGTGVSAQLEMGVQGYLGGGHIADPLLGGENGVGTAFGVTGSAVDSAAGHVSNTEPTLDFQLTRALWRQVPHDDNGHGGILRVAVGGAVALGGTTTLDGGPLGEILGMERIDAGIDAGLAYHHDTLEDGSAELAGAVYVGAGVAGADVRTSQSGDAVLVTPYLSFTLEGDAVYELLKILGSAPAPCH